jgi:hypothetical protein
MASTFVSHCAYMRKICPFRGETRFNSYLELKVFSFSLLSHGAHLFLALYYIQGWRLS